MKKWLILSLTFVLASCSCCSDKEDARDPPFPSGKKNEKPEAKQ